MMKKTDNNPLKKFKSLLKGSKTARNLSFIYAVLSLTLAFKFRNQIEYVFPLIFGDVLIIWYTLTHLLLKGIDSNNLEIKKQFNLYKAHIQKRQKYESFIFFIWLLTILPAYLYNQDITIFVVIEWMVILYFIMVFGGMMFKKVEKDLKDLEQQINNLDTQKLEF